MNTFASRHFIGVGVIIAAVLGCTTKTVVTDPPGPTTGPDQPQNAPVFAGKHFQAATPPAPISGGTLLTVIRQDGSALALASDPDEDTVAVVGLGANPSLLGRVALQPGDQPGRLVADAAGRVHVVLREGGAIATLIPNDTGASLLMRRTVCSAPRGIDYDAATDSIWVACATGELMSLPASGGAATVNVQLARDLRDVVVDGDKLRVTRFRSAEILTLDKTGQQLNAPTLPPMPSTILSASAPDVAWRTGRLPSGGISVLYQVASTAPIDVAQPPGVSSYGGETNTNQNPGGVVTVAVANIGGSASFPSAVPLVSNPVVDMAIAPDGSFETVSLQGVVETSNPMNNIQAGMVYSVDDGTATGTPDEFIAIADARKAQVPMLVLQRRGANPALIVIQVSEPQNQMANKLLGVVPIESANMLHVDTGFDVFHMPTSAGIACMNCHPEGGDDSHTWTFQVTNGDRVRRTQSLRGGVISSSAPYHWDGDMVDLQTLCDEVFTHRMGGMAISPEQTPALARFLNSMPRVPVRATLDQTRVAAGKAVFEGAGACSSCHTNGRGTLPVNQDIGKIDAIGSSAPLQVPMLVGVADRAPYMHDGCAATLMDRLTDTSCAGSTHGNVAALGDDDKQNLVEYLESL